MSVQPGPFILLEPGPRDSQGAKDDPHGGVDLITYYGLRRLYDQLATRGLDPVNYLRGVPGDSELRRGVNTDLAPLADLYSSLQTVEFRPFTQEQLLKAFTFQPGSFSLTEAEKGEVVSAAVRGGTPSSGATHVVGGREDVGGGAERGEKKKDKKKEKKDKKEKKKHGEKSQTHSGVREASVGMGEPHGVKVILNALGRDAAQA